MLTWDGDELMPEPTGPPEDRIHLVVHKSAAGGMLVEFRDRRGELARLTGPRVGDVLAWIAAAITNPFTRIIRKDLGDTA